MLGMFKKKKAGIVIVRLNARLQPMHRAELEDAFSDACNGHDLGAEVVGGGTLLADNGEVAACDIEVRVDDLSPDRIAMVGRLFEAMLAPKGSYMTVGKDSERIALGQH